MLQTIRRALLHGLKSCGAFTLVGNSQWRRRRLLILCYHAISQQDEHLWRPMLYMPLSVLQQRLELLERGRYNVLPLGEALERLQRADLPPRSVALTFDDGTYDFYRLGWPLLKQFGFPVTVYQTTYYSGHSIPVFNLVCSYMLWKRGGTVVEKGSELGLNPPLDLRTEESRQQIVSHLLAITNSENLNALQQNELAARLANLLDINYPQLLEQRLLQLMTSAEIAQLAREGVDFQLHTHRHRTPEDESLFRREIQDNRSFLQPLVRMPTPHFCYPSGVYRNEFLPWLQAEGVLSATTCNAGLASSGSHRLLLPRYVDTTAKTSVEVESWLCGIGSLIAVRTAAAGADPRELPRSQAASTA